MKKPRCLSTCRFALLLLVVGCSPEIRADGERAGEHAYFEPLPTVLTPSRLSQSISDAPGAVTIIDQDFIRATGYRDLARVFRLIPGMQVAQGRGDTQWVTYHGLSSANPAEIQVLIDGRSIYSPANFGGVDWTTLPVTIDEIDRIEVMRGTNPVTYGSNAFLGVINIITRPAGDDPGTKISTTLGAPGIEDLSARTTSKIGSLNLRLNMQHQHDDGFSDLSDSRDVNLFSLRGDYSLSNDDNLDLRLGASESEKGLGYGASARNPQDLHTQYGLNYNVHAQWRHAPSSGEECLIHYYHNSEQISEHGSGWASLKPSIGIGGSTVGTDMDRHAIRDHLEFQQHSMLSSSQQLVWGAEGRRDEIDAPFLYGGRDAVVNTVYRGFGNFEWKFAPRWQLTTGAALERYEDQPRHLSPRTFLNWQVDHNNTLRTGYARAWAQQESFASEGDLRPTGPASGAAFGQTYAPNRSLRQPKVDSMEIGYLGRSKAMSSSLDVRLFREHITGFIYRQADSTDAGQYQNDPNPVTLTGVEYQLKLNPWRDGKLLFSHTLIDTSSVNDNFKYRAAPYTAALSWQQHWNRGWSSMLTGLRMGPLAITDGLNMPEGGVSRPYFTVDARIAHVQQMNGKRVEYSLNAINLGKRHQEMFDSSLPNTSGTYHVNWTSPTIVVGASVEL
jgi:iron complex outermembrane recepter protein